MLRFLISLFCILSAMTVFPEFYTGKPMITGNALQNTDNGHIITVTALIDNNLNVEKYFSNNIAGALEKEGYLFIWDYDNHIDIYENIIAGTLMHSLDVDDSIHALFYGNDMLIVQTQRQTEFYYMDSLHLTSIRSPFNLHINDAAFLRDVICVSANNGNMIINVSIEPSGMELNDTVYAYGTDALVVNNFDILCAFRDTLIEYYLVTDSTIGLYSQHEGGRDIHDYRVINDMFYCWSDDYLYILDNDLVFSMQCLDSLYIEFNILDIDSSNNSISILSDNDLYYTANVDDLTLSDSTHIADDILSVFEYRNDYLIWTDNGLKCFDTYSDCLYMFNDSLLPLYAINDHVITDDTAAYFMHNDSLFAVKLNEYPVSISHVNNNVLYADADYNIYSNDSMLMRSVYPVLGISRYRGLITANGYYGFTKRDVFGLLKWNTYPGIHCLFIDSTSGGMLMATDDNILLADTMGSIKQEYTTNMKGIFRTDTVLYINSTSSIIAADDSLTDVLYDNNYHGICMIALGDMRGAMLIKGNALIELNYEITGFNEPISSSIDNNKHTNYIIYDIMGRFRGLKNASNNLKGVYFIRNGEETEKMINIQ